MKIFFQMQFMVTRVMPREILDALVKDLCPNAYGHINAFNSEPLTHRDIFSVGAKALHIVKVWVVRFNCGVCQMIEVCDEIPLEYGDKWFVY